MRPLTEGDEAKTLVTFALPMLAGNVFQQLYNTVDSIVVGQVVGKYALAAVGASFPIVFFMVSLVMGVTMGSSVMVAQFFGAKDHARLKKTIDTTAAFQLAAGLVVTVVGMASTSAILRAIRVPEEVFPQARSYLMIVFAGMEFTFGYNAIGALLRGLGDSKTPLYFLVVATLANIVLDLVFVVGFGWGINGAAWATVISQALSFAIGVRYMASGKKAYLNVDPRHLVLDRRVFVTMLRIGLPSGIQHSLVSLGFIALTRIVAPFGPDAMAGFTAASRLDSFAAMPAMNLSIALSMFVGQNLGAGNAKRVARGYLACLLIAGAIAVVSTFVMVVWRVPLIRLFTSDPLVERHGAQYLVVVSSFYVVFSAMFVTGGVLRGAGDTLAHMLFTLAALWVVRIPAAAILSARFGTVGIWWAIPAGWVVGLTLSVCYYLSGRWKRRVLVRPESEVAMT